MDKYYYLTSSLPLLKFQEKPYITVEEFIAEAKKWLIVGDFAILSQVDINNFTLDEKDVPIVRIYKDFEYSIRNELASFRIAKKKNTEYKIRKDLTEIIQEDYNPLEMEVKLLQLRWEFLEQQELSHFFDLDFLIIYYLKLQILKRLFSFDKQKGIEKFQVYSSVEL